MVINEIVEMYKGLETPMTVDDFLVRFSEDEEEFRKYGTKDIDETFKYLKRRKELLVIVDTKPKGWYYISKYMDLPLEFIAEFSDKISWREVSYNIPYDEEFIREFSDKVNWEVLFLKYTFNKEFLFENQDRIRVAIMNSKCD